MTDYSSWKVTDLKAELKKRGIPQTGLRLKQHFIDKLAEEDAKASTDDTDTAEAAPEAIAAETAQDETTQEPTNSDDTAAQQQPETQQPAQSHESEHEQTHEEDQAVTQEQPAPTSPPQEDQSQEPQPQEGETATETTDNQEQGEADVQSAEKAQPVEATAAPTAPSEEQSKPAPEEQGSKEASKEVQEEPVQAFEKSIPSVQQTSEANTELSTPLPIEEALEDKRKRKRRSQSPVPTPEAIAAKKARAEEDGPQLVSEDQQASVQERENDQGEQKTTDESQPTSAPKPPTPVKQDARFKGLFAPVDAAPARPLSPAEDTVMEDADVEPAMHAATPSLYIDGLMRPLQPAALRAHLSQLASAPGTSTNPEIIKEYYLDAIKTHCLVRFSDVQAASRVRSAIHGKVWPNERNRKNLWADFIPDDKIQEWIQTEEASRDRSGPPVRWEVRYETSDDGTTATLSEAGPNSRSAPTKPREVIDAPLGPRASLKQAERQTASNLPPAPSRPGQGFKPLDELFKSTTVKPKLYYLPVSRDVADKRLDQFDELLRKGSFPRRGGDEMRRITFEEDDKFVDIGPEYGRAAQQRPDRGGRGGRRQHRRR